MQAGQSRSRLWAMPPSEVPQWRGMRAGGIGAELGGGKFANGALTAAMEYLSNYCAHNGLRIMVNVTDQNGDGDRKS